MTAARLTPLCLLAALAAAVAPGTAHATFPGQNGKIAFGLNGIHTVSPDGSGLTQVTSTPQLGGDTEPDWSPDGTRIAFTRPLGCCPVPNDVWVVNADGSEAQRLATDGFSPAWSPDSTLIAFGRQSGIWTMSADGSGQTLLVADAASPSWSPDGRRIAFT